MRAGTVGMLGHPSLAQDRVIDPVRVTGGRYQAPVAPGYSAQMKPESLAFYAYPKGAAWREAAV